MKLSKKIWIIWLVLVSCYGLSLLLLPVGSFPDPLGMSIRFTSYSLQSLLLIICGYIFLKEPAKKNKYLFLNFALFFSLSVLAHLYTFVGTVINAKLFFPDERFAKMVIDQYVFRGAYFFLLALSIVYLTIDLLFRDFATAGKYLIALFIVGSFFGYYYRPMLVDPLYLHHTADVLDWKELDRTDTFYHERYGVNASPEVLAQSSEIYTWDGGEKTGELYLSGREKRVSELYPYLQGLNYVVLVYRPLFMNTVYMCVLSLGFILLFFGYQYMKDPPQGAYIEKIMFMFLIFCSMEIFHAWSFVKSVEWQKFAELELLGQVLSVVVILMIAIFFALRLRFITSVKGEFYEQELETSPNRITRWRDTLDNIVVEKFFNRKLLLGRMLVDPTHK
jgi:hypothetical protein